MGSDLGEGAEGYTVYDGRKDVFREVRREKEDKHAEEVGKSDQLNRAEGSRGGFPPCRVKGQRPLWGLGQRPNCFSSDQPQRTSQQGAGSEASLPQTSRVRRRAPNSLYPLLAHCRAKWARPSSHNTKRGQQPIQPLTPDFIPPRRCANRRRPSRHPAPNQHSNNHALFRQVR